MVMLLYFILYQKEKMTLFIGLFDSRASPKTSKLLILDLGFEIISRATDLEIVLKLLRIGK